MVTVIAEEKRTENLKYPAQYYKKTAVGTNIPKYTLITILHYNVSLGAIVTGEVSDNIRILHGVAGNMFYFCQLPHAVVVLLQRVWKKVYPRNLK